MITLSKSLNKFRLIFIFLLCSLSSYNIFSMEQTLAPSSISTQQHSLDIQNFLNQHAVEQKLGYKTANLILLNNQIVRDINFYQELTNSGYEIKIPEFIGISSEQTKQFINLNISEQWQQIISQISGQISERSESEPVEINPAQINTDNFDFFIRKTDELAKQILGSQLTEFYHVTEFYNENLAQFLDQAQEKNWYLGCRSTGLHEDTDEQSNAGGNESVMNVMPNFYAVGSAMQKVIASYFKSKSLNQRKNFGDQNIFELPETPLLIQRMIGEKINGADNIANIPVGCVIYTQEPFGNTPEVMLIQASFGHNAGVVDSKVGIDSYFVDNQNNIFMTIKKKPNRLVPTNIGDEFDLSFMTNPPEIQNIPCLQDGDVIAIKKVAQQIHNFYKKPMDIELVLEKNPENNLKTINLVQARPLHLTQSFNPQYIESTENLDFILCSTVSPADCSVRHITNKNQIIFTQSLEQALAIFNQTNFDQKQVKAVLVTEQAESNSHAAAIFRRTCLPIIEIQGLQNSDKIKSWLESQNTSLFIDVQRAVIINSEPEQINIINGYFKHPAPMNFFVPNSNIENFTTKNHVNFFEQDTDNILFEKLKTDDQDIAQKALETLLFKIKLILDNIGNLLRDQYKHNIAQNYFALIKNLYIQALNISNIIIKQEILSLPPRDVKRLFYINFLESLFFQEQNFKNINTYSLNFIKSKFEKENVIFDKILEKINSVNPEINTEIAQKLSDNYQLFSIAFAGYNAAFDQELGDCWINFLISILASNNVDINIALIQNIFEKLHACDMIQAFINLYFNKNRSQNSQDLLQIIFTELNNPNTIKFLQIFAIKRTELEAFDLTAWQDPKNFENLITLFNQQFVQFFTHPELISIFTNSESNNLLKLAIQSTMEKFVEVFDNSIKSLKSSMLYPDTNTNPLQVINFKKMLQAYLNVFDKWLILLPKDYICKNNEAPRVETIQEALNDTSNNNYELTASPEFNVNNCIWGCCSVDWNIEHAEDIFMLIHQNLLSILGMLSKHSYFNINETEKLIFPELFEKLNKKILEIEFNEDSPSLISIFVNNKKIYSRYNLPLNLHSLILELTYDMQTKNTELAINFVGSAEGPERWYKISALALTYSIIRDNIENLKIFDRGSNGTTLIYLFTDESNLSYIVKNIQEFAKITFKYIDEDEETIFPQNTDVLYNLTDKLIYLSPNNWQISKLLIELFERNDVAGLELFTKAQQTCSLEVLMPLYSFLVSLDYQEYFLPSFNLAIRYFIQNKKNYIYEDKTLSATKEILEELAKKHEWQIIIRKHADLFLLKHFSLAEKEKGLLLYSYLIDGNYESVYERALSIAEQEVMEYAHTQEYNEYEDAILELFNSLICKNIGINKILSIIEQLMQINLDTYKITNAKRIAINLCIFLLENIDNHNPNKAQINQLSLNVAYTILNKIFSTQITKENFSKIHKFKRLIQLFNVLMQNNIGITETTTFISLTFISLIYNPQLENLKKAIIMQLCSVLVESGPIELLDFVYQILVFGINTKIPGVQEYALHALNELAQKTSRYWTETTRIASKLIQSKSTMVFINAQKILRTIRELKKEINIKSE